jgi:hypothetical protein
MPAGSKSSGKKKATFCDKFARSCECDDCEEWEHNSTPDTARRESVHAPGNARRELVQIAEPLELLALEGVREKIRFSVDSGAQLTVATKDTASDYPRAAGPARSMVDCQGKAVEDCGAKVLCLKNGKRHFFSRVQAASVKKNLLAAKDLVHMGYDVYLSETSSCAVHRKTGEKIAIDDSGNDFIMEFDLVPYSVAGRPPPRPGDHE